MPQTLEDARAAMQSGDIARAREICETLHLTVGESADSLALLAAAEAQDGAFDAAADCLKRAIAHAPARPRLHANLGRMLMALGELDDAGKAFAKALAQVPGDPDITLHRAAVLANTGHPADAARLIRSVVAAAPDWEPVVSDLAFAERKLKERSLILKAINAARAGGDTRVETIAIQGEAAANLGSWAVAFECFEIAALARPDNPVYQAGLAASAHNLGRPSVAEEASRRAVALRPFTVRGASHPKHRALVAESFRDGLLRRMPTRRDGYAGSNYPGLLHHPDWQMIHAPVSQDAVSALAEVAARSDIIINNWVAAETLQNNPARGRIEALARNAGVPMINPPSAVLVTGRAETAERFRGINGLIFPETRTVRLDPRDPRTAETVMSTMTPPFIIRPVTGHRGKNAHLVTREADLADALRDLPFGPAYLIRYHDCRDEHGLSRRYRICVVGDTCYTVNMHAADDWNVHQVDRKALGWTERGLEEAERQFLQEPESVLGGPPETVLRPILKHTPLDIYGMDFGFDREGRIVMFEVNAAMAFSTDGLSAWAAVMEQRDRVIQGVFDYFEERIAASGQAA